jgi:ABC-type transport system substrate-binding protein
VKKRVSDLLVALAIALALVAAACGPTPGPETIVETVLVEQTRIIEKEGEGVISVETVVVEVEVEAIPAMTATPTPALPPPPAGNVLTLGVWGAMPQSRFCTLPPTTTGTEDFWLRRLSAATLMTLDENLEWTGDLAERYEVSDDGMSFLFFLRPGVTWHDDQPFTANDVEFTFDLILNPDIGAYHDVFSDTVSSVEAVDEYTVRFDMVHPIVSWDLSVESAWRSLVEGWTPVPKHILDGISAAEICDSEWAQDIYAYVGLGPYQAVSFDPGADLLSCAYLLYEPYDAYYGYQESSSPSPLDGIMIYFSQDPAWLATALEAGRMAMVQTSPQFVPQIDQNPDLKIPDDTALLAVNQAAWPPADPYVLRALLEPPGETFVPYRESPSELADIIGRATILPKHPETEAAISELGDVLGGVRINKARTVSLAGNPRVVHLAPIGPESAPASEAGLWDDVREEGWSVLGTFVVVQQDPQSEADRVQAFAVRVIGEENSPEVEFVGADGLTYTGPITFEVPLEPAEIPSAGIDPGSFWCRGECLGIKYWYPCGWW